MRRVVGGYHVYYVQVGPQRVYVSPPAEGGLHEAEAAKPGQVVLGQIQVMRGNLARYGQATLFGVAYQLYLHLLADVAEMHASPDGGEQAQHHRQRAVLSVYAERFVRGPGQHDV